MSRGNSRLSIQRALFSLLEEKPIEKVTVSEVVRRAGVSRTTYYRAYYSLQEVLDDALDEVFSRVESIVLSVPGKGGGDRREFEFSTYQILNLYRENVDVLQSLLQGSASLTLQKRLYELTLRLMGELDESPASPRQQMERAYVAAGMSNVISQWVIGGCETPIMDVLDFIIGARSL